MSNYMASHLGCEIWEKHAMFENYVEYCQIFMQILFCKKSFKTTRLMSKQCQILTNIKKIYHTRLLTHFLFPGSVEKRCVRFKIMSIYCRFLRCCVYLPFKIAITINTILTCPRLTHTHPTEESEEMWGLVFVFV